MRGCARRNAREPDSPVDVGGGIWHAILSTAVYRGAAMAIDGRSNPSAVRGFAAIRRGPRLSDRVADAILETIAHEHLQAGAPLPSERDLGEQFGVSRTVIREAIRALDAIGVIEVRSGSRARVAGADSARAREVLARIVRALAADRAAVADVQAALTLAAAGLAAERLTSAGIELLREILADPQAGAPGFLRAVVAGAGNPLLAAIHEATAADPAVVDSTPAELERLLDAIARGDATDARAVVGALLRAE